METIKFSDLNLSLVEDTVEVEINEQHIKVKQYLPAEKQIEIISNVLRNSADDNNFANPTKVEVFFNLELIYAYTDIEFTEEEKENPVALYDILESNDVFAKIISVIPQFQYEALLDNTNSTIENYYRHVNSALGILEQVSTDYKGMDFDAEKIKEKINGPSLDLVKDIVEKLG